MPLYRVRAVTRLKRLLVPMRQDPSRPPLPPPQSRPVLLWALMFWVLFGVALVSLALYEGRQEREALEKWNVVRVPEGSR